MFFYHNMGIIDILNDGKYVPNTLTPMALLLTWFNFNPSMNK